MNELLQRIGVAAWPIWVKLLVGFLAAVVIPLTLVLGLIFSTVQQVGLQNIQSFVSETSGRQALAINTAFDLARGILNDFVGDANSLSKLRDVLVASISGEAGTTTSAAIFDVGITIQNQLLISAGAAYEQIDLIDANGILVVRSSPAGVVGRGADLSNTAIFQQMEEARLRGDKQTMVVDVGTANKPVIEVVNVLSTLIPGQSGRVTIGYLVGRLRPDAIVGNNLAISSDVLQGSSRLVTRRGFVIDAEGASFESNLDVNTTLMDEATNSGHPQIETLQQPGGQRVRTYVPITDTPFLLVTDAAADTISGQMINFIVERGFALILGVIFLVAVLVILLNQLFSPPLRRIGQAIQAMGRGNYNFELPDVQRGDEIGDLAGSVADTRRRVLDLISELEQRIEARARDMTATREISHAAATQRDLQQLLEQVVNLIIQRFPNIYHAQIFLNDAENRYALLRASTGEAGRQLLARGHRLAVGSVSVVGRVTENGDMVVARDAESSRVHRRNELLPDTRAELAIALRVGNRIIGALDVQSRQSEAFDAEQMEVLQTMADQVAVAIENARLYTESVRRLEELEQNRRLSTLQAWHQYMNSLRLPRLESAVGTIPEDSVHGALRQAALERGQVAVGDLTARQTIPIAVPIRLRGQLLGTVEWEVPQSEFDQNKVQLAQDLTDRLAVNLDNARLFQESQRIAQRERLVNEISAQLTTQNDIDQILQTAVREVGRALRSPHVSIRLNPQEEAGGHNGQHTNGHANEQSNGQGE